MSDQDNITTHKPLFIFLRKNPKGEMSPGKPHTKGVPVACLAYAVDRENQTLYYELSTHNPTDVFDRQGARVMAEGRFREHPCTFQFSSKDDTLTKIFYDLATMWKRYPYSRHLVRKTQEGKSKTGQEADVPTRAYKALYRHCSRALKEEKQEPVEQKPVNVGSSYSPVDINGCC